MDKKELRPMKKCPALLLILPLLIFLASGCNTVKGAAAGAGKDWKSMKEADQGLREVLW